MNKNILLVGVGGQGTVLAGNLVADALMRAGHDVKKSEVHGMAQRGGSVSSHICYGEKVYSAIVGEGEADFIVAFERLEALRYLHFVREDGRVVVNDFKIPPPSVATGKETYSDNIVEVSRERGLEALVVPGIEFAKKAGNIRTANVALVGALSVLIGGDEELWIRTLRERFPEKLVGVNEKALRLGRTFIQQR
ncbi:MAG: indolepyruvate oxidoreductase subunit beta [Proteobacteria bacterium]|nr:indolepyruvate oxidoreductase subunit beta [Pseudomonadota bacterium]